MTQQNLIPALKRDLESALLFQRKKRRGSGTMAQINDLDTF